jgi:DNA-binding beta-propeller fold protein YncE
MEEADKQTHATPVADPGSRVAQTPNLPFRAVRFAAQAPAVGWESGFVSWMAIDSKGLIYEIQRGNKADPILVLDRDGKVLRSWGKGDYKVPHSIRIDPSGNIWTVDAASSTVIKYSSLGEKLMTITVGEQSESNGPFNGATDIAFGSDGHLFIADGYGNARILEYAPDGRRVKQWGKPGSGPGEFRVPHAIQIDEDGIIYVADRENGRIEKFTSSGLYLGEFPHLGRIYSLKLSGDTLWASIQSFEQAPGSAGWVVKLDRKTGRMLGHLDVAEARGLHCVEQGSSGEPITTLGNELLWFKAK